MAPAWHGDKRWYELLDTPPRLSAILMDTAPPRCGPSSGHKPCISAVVWLNLGFTAMAEPQVQPDNCRDAGRVSPTAVLGQLVRSRTFLQESNTTAHDTTPQSCTHQLLFHALLLCFPLFPSFLHLLNLCLQQQSAHGTPVSTMCMLSCWSPLCLLLLTVLQLPGHPCNPSGLECSLHSVQQAYEQLCSIARPKPAQMDHAYRQLLLLLLVLLLLCSPMLLTMRSSCLRCCDAAVNSRTSAPFSRSRSIFLPHTNLHTAQHSAHTALTHHSFTQALCKCCCWC